MLQRILNRLVTPLGLKCIKLQPIVPAKELPAWCIEHARIVASREDILPLLPKGGVVAEVGVAFGKFSRKILAQMCPQLFVAIDTFDLDRASWTGRQAFSDIFRGSSHEAYFRDAFRVEIANGTVVVKKGYSKDMIAEFPDAYFDMIYIDASHDYANVVADLDASASRVKANGCIVLNDYTIMDPLLREPYGVVQAAHEFCIREKWEIVYLALHPHMFCDVVLRRIL